MTQIVDATPLVSFDEKDKENGVADSRGDIFTTPAPATPQPFKAKCHIPESNRLKRLFRHEISTAKFPSGIEPPIELILRHSAPIDATPVCETNLITDTGVKIQRDKVSDRRAFEELPRGWSPSVAPSKLKAHDVETLQKQSYAQAQNFEVLSLEDVEVLSKVYASHS